MKLRILNNSLRLRFSQTELEELHNEGIVYAKIEFGGEGNTLHYKLVVDEETEVLDADFTDNWIMVSLPSTDFDKLYESDQVGVENNIPLDEGGHLHVLVEKDFKCLDKREGEEDLFSNPKEEC